MTPSRLAFAAILGKDLRAELRTLQSLPAMALFAVTTFVIFRFGLDRTSLSGSLAAGVLWVTLLFAAVLGINRLFVAEREEGGFDAIRLAPIDRTALFFAKASALLAYLLVLELVVVPVFAVFFLDSAAALPPLALVLLLADLGLARIALGVVGDEDPRAAGVGADQGLGELTALGVEVGVGLVEQQQLWPVQGAAADRQALAHSGGELGDPFVGAALHRHGSEQLGDP